MLVYIGIFLNGKLVHKLSNIVPFSNYYVMELMTTVYESKIKTILRKGEYVAWDYYNPQHNITI
jgi:hypothetical protein